MVGFGIQQKPGRVLFAPRESNGFPTVIPLLGLARRGDADYRHSKKQEHEGGWLRSRGPSWLQSQ
jgi:hypothetical protein